MAAVVVIAFLFRHDHGLFLGVGGLLVALVSSERNASARMVLGYWDMAASLVTSGAIDAESFRAAHGEVFATFSKIHPFLSELRTASGEADFCKHLEAVV